MRELLDQTRLNREGKGLNFHFPVPRNETDGETETIFAIWENYYG